MNSPLLRFLVRKHIAVANLSLAVILLFSGGFLLVHIMRVNPLKDTYDVTVEMSASGGLMPNSDVTYRGYRVGTIRSVDLSKDGVVAVAEIESWARIADSGDVAVHRLSAVGEQYLDFRPDSTAGPYLSDGSVIDSAKVKLPATIESILSNTSGWIDGLNPQRLGVIVEELDIALAGGPDRLRNVISGLSTAMAGLTNLLPQTANLIRSLQVISSTTSQVQPDLSTLVQGSGVLFDQLGAADQEVRQLLDLGPGQLASLGGVLQETADPITNLVTNFIAITRSARLRTSAMTALFPALRAGTAALGIPAYNNEFHTLLDIWPRPTCEYDTIPIGPTVVGDGRTRLYNYCVTDDPALQIRGSANAPRPSVPDNGSGPPPGVTGDELSRPIPGR